MRLYELQEEIAAIENAIEEAGGEITDEIAAKLDGLEGDFESKVTSIVAVIKNQDAYAKIAAEEAKRLAAVASSRGNTVDSLKQYLKINLENLGRTDCDTTLGKVRIQRNSRPSIEALCPPEELPAWARREIPARLELDSNAVLEIWKTNPLDIPATITVKLGSHIRIGK